MKALVTGGAGFIGSHLVDRLVRSGAQVTVLDDLSTGNIENLAVLHFSSAIEFYYGTIEDCALLSRLITRNDVVFHLAAVVGVERVLEDPLHAMQVNISGTESLLKLANVERKRVLLTSSIEVVGKSRSPVLTEEDDIVFGSSRFPRWSYACSKAANEFMALSYYATFGLPVSIVRLTNTVGPRQIGEHGMVIPRFISQALRGESLTVFGNGSKRDVSHTSVT